MAHAMTCHHMPSHAITRGHECSALLSACLLADTACTLCSNDTARTLCPRLSTAALVSKSASLNMPGKMRGESSRASMKASQYGPLTSPQGEFTVSRATGVRRATYVQSAHRSPRSAAFCSGLGRSGDPYVAWRSAGLPRAGRETQRRSGGWHLAAPPSRPLASYRYAHACLRPLVRARIRRESGTTCTAVQTGITSSLSSSSSSHSQECAGSMIDQLTSSPRTAVRQLQQAYRPTRKQQ